MGDRTNEQTVWNFGFFNSGTKIGLKYEGDGSGFAGEARGNGVFYADAWTTLGPVELKIGNTEREWAQWSSLNTFGDNNWGFGAGASSDLPYFQVAYRADALSVYFGLQEAGASGKILSSKVDPTDNKMWELDWSGFDYDDQSTWTVAPEPIKYGVPFPGFFIGGDYTMEDVATFGFAFAGQFVGKKYGGDEEKGTFPLMFNLHGKALMLSPLTIGLNLTFYMAPTKSALFSIRNGALKGAGIIEGEEAMVLEAMLDISAALEPCNVGFTAAYVMNFANKEKQGGGSALKIGASATFPVGETGFSITPGVMYTNYLKVFDETEGKAVSGKAGSFGGGITLAYSF